jgi:hypothetical protein
MVWVFLLGLYALAIIVVCSCFSNGEAQHCSGDMLHNVVASPSMHPYFQFGLFEIFVSHTRSQVFVFGFGIVF